MYSKNGVFVTYFVDEGAKNTDKLFNGRVSEAIKVGTLENGKPKYEFESWNARFVGKAYEKAKKLQNMTGIKLTEWSARNPYSKESKKNYPYLMVTDFEIVEKNNT